MSFSPRVEALIEYLAVSDPLQVNKLAYKYGYNAPQTPEGREGFLATFLEENPTDGLMELMLFHPDKEAIIAAQAASMNTSEQSGFNGNRFNGSELHMSNASGADLPGVTTIIKTGISGEFILIAGILVVLYLIIIK